ncbi:hypothetical protein [Modestobacter sp. VKM Ac-2985]|uniref:hypothetical protein n=1 Tax=Modestobacter sp. VKM Ac-2985 TaxID=3004139 RepID=UPI0022AB7513|nr:hypothetical protein [Modestobacter sp. VKM Ac-2985]MCZ2836772.1 hypothetical protein [Modestobacter sp. VKM Ac-2985]
MTAIRHVAAVDALGEFLPLGGAVGSQHADLLIGYTGQDLASAGPPACWPGESLLKRVGVRRGLSRAECLAIGDGYLEYRHALARQTTWQMPRLAEVVAHGGDQEWHLLLIEQYVRGESLSAFLGSTRHSAEYRQAALAAVLRNVLSHPETNRAISVNGHRLRLVGQGVDLKPSNVVVATIGSPYLVDQFPPLLLDGSGAVRFRWERLHTFSEEKLKILCFTKAGAMLRLLRLLQLSARSVEEAARLTRGFLATVQAVGPRQTDWRFLWQEVQANFPTLRRLYAGATS